MIAVQTTPLIMSEVTDPQEIARIQAQRDRFRKNSDWLQARIPEVYSRHRGKHICVAGQELFLADTALEVLALARQAHPEDDGLLLRYIPREKMERIYAHSRDAGCSAMTGSFAQLSRVKCGRSMAPGCRSNSYSM